MKASIAFFVVVIIFSSTEVKVEFVPYTASIIYNKQHVCSGSIISNKWVVSAAQCFIEPKTKKNREPKTITVSVGKDDWKEGKKYKVTKIVRHKDFAKGTNKANIALLQVADKITAVKPVNLQKEQVKNGLSVKISGWRMAGLGRKSVNPSTKMQVSDVTTAPLKECSAQQLGKTSLCTIAKEKKGQCVGDIGAPLVYKNKLIGVTSNPGNCKDKRIGIHTSVAHYHGWIRNTISPGSPERSQTSFPYTAAIIYKKDYSCAGAIVGSSWVLTAAQCAKDRSKVIAPSDLKVSVGSDTWMKGTYHEVFKIYINSNFDPQDKKNDIAVIDVKKKFMLGPTIKVIPLDNKKYDRETAKVSGWGLRNGKKGQQAANIQSASVVLSPLDKCNLKKSESQLCTVIKAGQPSCPGDVGGPLVLNTKLIGVVSTSGDCKTVKYSTYSSIPHYRTWIKKQFELVSNETSDKSSNDYIDSKMATTQEHQYSATIWYNGEMLCGGSLVSSFVVMTVADHFFSNASGLEIPSNLFEVYLWGGPAGNIYWKEIHPGYEYDKPLHNIALVYLPILRDHPHPPTKVNTNIELDGDNTKTTYLSIYVNSKRQVEYFNMKLLPIGQCRRYHKFINENSMVCAFLRRSDGTCLEGTGQPLMFKNQMVAMQSFGGSCEDLEPSVYLVMSHYEEWIKDSIDDLSA